LGPSYFYVAGTSRNGAIVGVFRTKRTTLAGALAAGLQGRSVVVGSKAPKSR
jgi:hypothetical protein